MTRVVKNKDPRTVPIQSGISLHFHQFFIFYAGSPLLVEGGEILSPTDLPHIFYENRTISLLLESKDCVRDHSRTIIKEIPFHRGDFFLGEIYSHRFVVLSTR